MLNSLVETINQAFEGRPFIILPIMISMFIITNLKSILSFICDLKIIQIKKIKEALDSNYLTENIREFLKEELENEYFRLIKGIYVEKPFRDKLLSIHKESSGSLTFRTIKRGFKYIKFSDSKIEIKFTKWDIIEYYGNWLFFGIFLLIAIFFFLLPQIITSGNILYKLIIFGLLGFISLLFSIFSLAQTNEKKEAERIKKFIDNHKQERDTNVS